MTADQLRARAAAKRAEAQRIADSCGAPDRAGAMLSGRPHVRALKTMDSALRRSVEATKQAQALEGQAIRAEGREREAARVKLTHADLVGATHVLDQFGQWRRVVRLSAKSVTVTTAYSWTDRIPLHKVHAARTITTPGPTS